MKQHKTCPMGKLSGYPSEYLCEEDKCAWWCNDSCVICSIAQTLREIEDEMPSNVSARRARLGPM